ncbi:hypothetical protein Tco_0241400 [Tanacetum coccineum]
MRHCMVENADTSLLGPRLGRPTGLVRNNPRINRKDVLYQARIARGTRTTNELRCRKRKRWSSGKGLDRVKIKVWEEPVEIMEQGDQTMMRSRIPLVKVRWNLRRGPVFTWEREDSFKQKYPHSSQTGPRHLLQGLKL